jgi:polysaccharide deacetylase family protein (PEP-CTERM system associated)
VLVEHIFSVDVEDYFQVSAFEGIVDRSRWDDFPCRVERNTDILLELLYRHNASGTFFTLGWVAQKCPGLIRRIVDAGHEIASHGWWHRRVTSMTPEEFREDIHSAKAILEDVSGQRVLGYRAPSFSITPQTQWALDVLIEVGYQYDSSLFPIARTNYGFPDTPPIPHIIHRPNGDIIEFPLATMRMGKKRIPAAGGGYLRHFPYAIIRRAFQDHAQAGTPGVFYIHPWEIDADQPRLEAPLLTRVRHYRNLDKTLPRLERLLSEFHFTSIAKRMMNSLPALNVVASPTDADTSTHKKPPTAVATSA